MGVRWMGKVGLIGLILALGSGLLRAQDPSATTWTLERFLAISADQLTASELSAAEPDALIRQILPLWRAETDAAKRLELRTRLEQLEQATYDPDLSQVLEEDALGALQIAIPAGAESVALEPLVDFETPTRDYNQSPLYVQRRITPDRIELWTPTAGWLFDARGTLLKQVKVPRRDGHGKEWYGAFLPDGRWITTDLWMVDKQLHFYRADGSFERSLPIRDAMRDLMRQQGVAEPELEQRLDGSEINWARATADGAGWIMGITYSTYGQEQFYFCDAQGNLRLLAPKAVWGMAMPRELGTRGDWLTPLIYSDAGELAIKAEFASHGRGVGYPGYEWYPETVEIPLGFMTDQARSSETLGRISIVNGSANFGFWPGSDAAYVARKGTKSTVLLDATGKITGWIAGVRFSDAADGRAMLFEAEDGRIVTLGADHAIREVRAFTWSGGEVARVEDLYDDLKLGFFMQGETLVLAEWE